MRRLLHDERGIGLPEVLITMILGVVLLGAVLGTFEGFLDTSGQATQRSIAQDRARDGVDRVTREVRNATPNGGSILERAEPDDLMFVAVGGGGANGANARNLRRKRLCLDVSSTDAARLILQTQTWTTATVPVAASSTSCPGTGWTATEVVAEKVTNRRAGQAARAAFAYRRDPASSTAPADIVAVRTTLHVDEDVARKPAEVDLSSSVGLRNTNRPPTAAFSVAQQGGSVVLDASASSDPEGNVLEYAWYRDGSSTSEGSAVRLEQGSLTPGSSHTWRLVVTDVGSLTAQASQTVVIQ